MDAAVGLVKAYLEMSGFFVLTEIPVRARDRHGFYDVTDVDIISVRFPHRHDAASIPATLRLSPFIDPDPELAVSDEVLEVVIGEVKEGRAHLNAGLKDLAAVAFALRRIGCCPDAQVDQEARAVIRGDERLMHMPAGGECRVRLVCFAGHGTARSAALTISLGHCLESLIDRLAHSDLLATAQFKDPLLSVISLEHKFSNRTQISSDERVAT